MNLKVYTSGNYLIIESITDLGVSDKVYSALSKEVYVKNHNDTAFSFHGVDGVKETPVLLSNLLDESGAAYTLQGFKAFYTANTGELSVTVDFKTEAQYTELSEEEKNNGTIYFITEDDTQIQ